MGAPYAAVLFDLDGTLVNTIPLIMASYKHAFVTVTGREPDDDESRAWIGQPLLPALLAADPDRGEELYRVYSEWNLGNSGLIERYDGIPELLDTLREAGVLTGVVTSKRAETARVAFDAADLTGRVELIATLETTAVHKPNPEPLLAGAAALRVAPSQCVYVGDATVDVRAAHAAGMSSIAVTWGAGSEADLRGLDPTAVVGTVGELASLLLGKSEPRQAALDGVSGGGGGI